MKPLLHSLLLAGVVGLSGLSTAALAANASTAHATNAAPAAAGAPKAAEAWTPASLRAALAALPKGDAERGKTLNQSLFCASCHGNEGVAPTQNWPHLAGQRAAYTAKMLLDYQRSLRRENQGAALMHDVAVMLTPQQIADLAAYYERLPAPREDGTPRPKKALDPETLVRKGDPSRLITPCASCHGTRAQGGKFEAAALAGQNPKYLLRTLLDYQSGVRNSDAARGMREFATRLTREEMEALATYYADLPVKKR